MADQSDVEITIANLVTGLLYPQGINAPSVLGVVARIYRGWPNASALNTDLASGHVNISLFPDPGQHRITTRYIDPPTAQATVQPTLAATVSGNAVTFVGDAQAGQIAGVLVDNAAAVHRTAVGDTPQLVAAIIASYIQKTRLVTCTGATVTIPGANLLIGRVVADQQTQTETRRQIQGFRLSCWCPDPTTRDLAASLLDAGLSSQSFIMLPDGTSARMRETGTVVFDQSQNAGLYRRDLLLAVEYATTLTTTQPAMIFGDSRILPLGTTVQSLLG